MASFYPTDFLGFSETENLPILLAFQSIASQLNRAKKNRLSSPNLDDGGSDSHFGLVWSSQSIIPVYCSKIGAPEKTLHISCFNLIRGYPLVARFVTAQNTLNQGLPSSTAHLTFSSAASQPAQPSSYCRTWGVQGGML